MPVLPVVPVVGRRQATPNDDRVSAAEFIVTVVAGPRAVTHLRLVMLLILVRRRWRRACARTC
jgi:hypothetical protein